MRFFIGVIASLVLSASALYEKEAGHYDWTLDFIGNPVEILPSNAIKGALIIGTENGIIAAVDGVSGTILWKVTATSSAHPIAALIETTSGLIVAKFGESVISIAAATGLLSWTKEVRAADSVIRCTEPNTIQLSSSGEQLNSRDGSLVTAGSIVCESAPTPLSVDPVTVDRITVSVGAGHVLSGVRDGRPLWTREESLASVDQVAIVSGVNGPVGKNDLSWLIGSTKLAVALSKRARRIVVIDIAKAEIVRRFLIEDGVASIRASVLSNTIELLDSTNVVVHTIDLSQQEPLSEVRTASAKVPSVRYKIDESTGRIVGYKANLLVAEKPLWSVSLTAPILSIVKPDHTQYGSVPVLVKGDASVVFKYMNPNLIVVITPVQGDKGLTVTAVDTVTGVAPLQTVIPTASSHVASHFVLCDNWIVGHYYNVDSNRFEVISIDLFERREDKGFYAAATGQSATVNSAFELPTDPIAVSQQYVFPLGPVTAVTVTATLKGVTPRQIMFATANGLLAVRKDTWLNPRRPVAGSPTVPARLAVTSEESLPPYSAVLPVIPTDFVSHAHIIENVSVIASTPTHLESTSIVIAFSAGSVFSSPVYLGTAPYDVLSPFFNYWLLYVSVAVVTGGVLVTSVLARRADLYNKWK